MNKSNNLKVICKSIFVMFLFSGTQAANSKSKLAQISYTEKTDGISFTENKGQMHDQHYKPRPDVLFGAMAGNMAFHLKTTGVSYQLTKAVSYKEVEDLITKEKRKEIDLQTIYRVDLSWINANNNFTISTDETLQGYNNYYLESCPNGALNVKSYTGITAHNLYNGINLHYYEKEGQLKHDYIVASGANYKQIQLRVDGAKVSINNDGSLLLNTPLGKIQEGAPIVYQSGKQLRAKWKIKNSLLSFEIENYNPNKELIIDPVTRVWGTYYGIGGSGTGISCATDAQGNVYLAGRTPGYSSTLIATAGSHQGTIGSLGNDDAYLVKFNSSGVRQWGTYYGGTGADEGRSCATDAIGNIYLGGETSSTTVISTAGSHQVAFGGGTGDAFLVKFNSNGIRQWGTYYGTQGPDESFSCASDATGNIYLAGVASVSNTNAIASTGAHQANNGGGQDAFIAKFDASGVRQWGTYYGGNGSEYGRSCATDATGNIYLAGTVPSTTASNVISTSGAHQTVFGGSSEDAFLVKFNTNGVRQWGTFYGGNGGDEGHFCATDPSGNVYLGGNSSTNSSTNPIATPGSHQASSALGGEAFLVKFNSNGVRQWGTFYGGSGADYGRSCATDASGNVFLAGYTSSNTLIATAATHQFSNGGGSFDGFLAKFNSSGTRQWGTYYGGPGVEYGYACAVDATGKVYLTGTTTSTSGYVIASSDGHQLTPGSIYLAKFDDCIGAPANVVGNDVSICTNNAATISATSPGATINWYASPTSTQILSTGSVFTTAILNAGTYTYYAEAVTCTTSFSRTAITVTVHPNPTVSVISNIDILCLGESTTLSANGALSYTFTPGGAGQSIVVSPTTTTSYLVTGTDVNGCQNTTTFTQNVDACTSVEHIYSTNSDLLLYPNPVNSRITIETKTLGIAIQLNNILGEQIRVIKLVGEKNEIDLSDLAAGIYFIKNESQTFKIIKQ